MPVPKTQRYPLRAKSRGRIATRIGHCVDHGFGTVDTVKFTVMVAAVTELEEFTVIRADIVAGRQVLGFTDTFRVAGVVPLAGATESQLPPPVVSAWP